MASNESKHDPWVQKSSQGNYGKSNLIGRTFTLTCNPPVNFTTARVVAIEHGLILIQGAGKDADRGQVWIPISAIGQLVPVDA